ncbi:hypothetical protein [Metabacillus sp. RGM 3146]|uniref:hypothetical protein n=1 Tax=Metabacillus sp. RGM 3146 TaxID=3401092 RepID=UPI003B9900F3
MMNRFSNTRKFNKNKLLGMSLLTKIAPFTVLSTITFTTIMTGSASAQDTEYTRQGAGPMYFSTYEYQFTNNSYMHEDEYKKDIDWMAQNFKPYGYDMISTDGWIEGASLLNKNGYVVSHNNNWMTNPLGSKPITGQLQNGDFEDGLNGWNVETNAYYGVDSNDAYEGSKLWVYGNDPHTAKVSQTVTGLGNGNYTVTARVKFPNGDVNDFINGTSTANMKLKDFADGKDVEAAPEQTVELKDGLTDASGKPIYGLFEVHAEVTNGRLTIEFNVDAKAKDSSFQLDDVELYKTGEKPSQDNEPFQYPSEKYPEGHTWKYWGNYIHEKGMKFGVYYNPLWVSPEVVKHPDKYIVQGTEHNPGGPIYVTDMIDQGNPNDPNDGDRFSGGSPNAASLYWLNVDYPGAEQYIKGYVKYFADQGADFLRVDFLSWYETGKDPNLGTVGQAHEMDYETALKWMSEAARENHITLSLVMPNLSNHGELEQKYGDMIRIDEDTFQGGWDHISGRRQSWQPAWSQWANAFQGFTGFSDISGRSNMMLDGDFLRLNTYSGDYAENEKKTTMSLYTLAGSPLAISDRPDTIGNDYKYYQNTELIEFNKMGLVGKPIYESAVPYEQSNGSRDSQRWAGQLPDGSWVVGLFNRQDASQTFDFNFKDELGIEKGEVRDLWAHKDLGIQSSSKVTLAPHDSVVYKIVPANTDKTFEAEVASYSRGVQFAKETKGYNGFGYLKVNKSGQSVTYAISTSEAGVYHLKLNYSADEASKAALHVRDVKSGECTYSTPISLNATKGKWKEANEKVKLKEGTNLVTVHDASGSFNLDSITLRNAQVDNTPGTLQNGDFNKGFDNWSRSNMVNQSIVNGAVQIGGTDANPFHSDLWQYVVPKGGIYTLRANVKRNGNFDDAYLYVQNGKDKQIVEVPASEKMKKVTISHINVSKGDVLKIGNIANSQAGGTLTMDDVQLIREESK